MKFTAVTAAAAVLAATVATARPIESYDLDARDFIDADMDEYYSREFDDEFEAREVYDEFDAREVYDELADLSARDLLDAIDELYARGGAFSKIAKSDNVKKVVTNPTVRKAAVEVGKQVYSKAGEKVLEKGRGDKKKKRDYYDEEEFYARGGAIGKMAKSDTVKKVVTNPTVRKAASEVGKQVYSKAGEKVLEKGRKDDKKKKRDFYDEEEFFARGAAFSKIAKSENVKKVVTNPTVRKAAVEVGKQVYSKAGEKVLEKGRGDKKKKRDFYDEEEFFARGAAFSKMAKSDTVKKVVTNPTVRKAASEVGKQVYSKAGEKVLEKGRGDKKNKRDFWGDYVLVW